MPSAPESHLRIARQVYRGFLSRCLYAAVSTFDGTGKQTNTSSSSLRVVLTLMHSKVEQDREYTGLREARPTNQSYLALRRASTPPRSTRDYIILG